MLSKSTEKGAPMCCTHTDSCLLKSPEGVWREDRPKKVRVRVYRRPTTRNEPQWEMFQVRALEGLCNIEFRSILTPLIPSPPPSA